MNMEQRRLVFIDVFVAMAIVRQGIHAGKWNEGELEKLVSFVRPDAEAAWEAMISEQAREAKS